MKLTKLSAIKKLVTTQVRLNSDLKEFTTEGGEIVYANELALDELVFDANHEVLKDFAFVVDGKTYTTNEDGGIILILDAMVSDVADENEVTDALDEVASIIEDILEENTLSAIVEYSKKKVKLSVEMKDFETAEGVVIKTDELEVGHLVYDAEMLPYAEKEFEVAGKVYVTGEFGEIVEVKEVESEVMEELVELKKELKKIQALYTKQVSKGVNLNATSTDKPLSRMDKIKALKK